MGEVPPVWRVGDVIADQYEVTHVHSSGGMGLVYRVRHLRWDTDLAVKCPRPEMFRSPGGRNLFVTEAETWVSLGLHPNVCSCHYVRVLGGIPRVFAEYVPGGSLRDRIDDHSLYTGDDRRAQIRILDLAIQTAWGLQHAHDRGLVHQDVKPANVLIDDDGTAKVTDFGLARARTVAAGTGTGDGPARAGASVLVSTGGMTRAYASPEQAEGLPLNRRTDVYSFAVSVLEMFTGGVTWMMGSVAGEALAAYRAEGPGESGPPPMCEGVAELLERCLAQRPEDRPRSMADVATELRALYRRIAGHDHPRPEPHPADLRAGELNNRALSLLDLGRPAEAEESFAAALAADPRHPEAIYNLGVLRWRRGAITDEDLVADLEAVHADTGRSRLDLLTEVRRERGETPSGGPEIRRIPWYVYEQWAESRRGERVRRSPPGIEIRLTPDGRLALTACDGTVRLWEVATGRCLLEPAGATHAVDISADGRYAAGVGSDQLVRLWDLGNGRGLRTFTPHYRSGGTVVRSLRLALDAGSVAAGTSDGTVVVWAVGNGQARHVVEGYLRGPVEVSSDGGLMLFRTQEGIACVPEAAAGHDRRVLPANDQLDVPIHLAADRRTAATAHVGEVRVWDVESGECVRAIACSAESLALSDDSRLLLTGGRDGVVRLWEVATGRCLRSYRGHSGRVAAVVLPPGGGRALSAGEDGTARWWRLPAPYTAPPRLSRPRRHAELTDSQRRVTAMVGEAERARATGRLNEALDVLTRARATQGHERTPEVLAAWRALGRERGVVRTALRAGWSPRIVASHDAAVVGLACSADGTALAVRLGDRTGHVLDAGTGESHLIIGDLPNSWGPVELTPDGRRLLLANPDGSLDVWSVTTGDRLASLRLTLGAGSARFTADGRLALVRGGDHTVRLWDMESGECLRSLDADHDMTTTLWLDPDGRLAATSGSDNAIRLWDLDDRRCLRVFRGHTHAIHALQASADRRFLLSTGWYDDRTIRVWDTATGECVRVLESPGGNARAARPTGDGRFVVSCGDDSAIRVWGVTGGRCLRALTGHTGSVNDVVLGPGGNVAFSAGADGTVRAWEFDWDLAVRGPSGAGPKTDSDGKGGGHAVVP
ncbi:serine/threonine-protein kinase [Actinoallomurus sp. NPDC050550]|uniref:WD40 repeat domain-containing serine/threonine protein kinase n=1 Tax=Actinoallomurus sp. NPDC050550 TaxID=3154937 RepID=UPI0033EB07F8